MSVPIHGICDEKFQKVADAFTENFNSRGEAGASVCLIVNGEKQVDLWGGYRDHAQEQEWLEDTLSVVFSCTKAATALCVHILIDRGEIALDDKVTRYWPEFAQNGKQNVTLRMMLNHTSAVPALRAPVKPDGFLDFDYMVERLAAETPFWIPGKSGGYHMITFGWTIGEMVRRVSGKSPGQFFKDEIANPFGVDFHISLPESGHGRVAPMIPYIPGPQVPPPKFVEALRNNPNSLQYLSILNTGGWNYDTPESYKADIGGAGGLSNARGIAAMFAPLLKDGALLSTERIFDIQSGAQKNTCDKTLLIPTCISQGFMLSMDNRSLPNGDVNSVILGRHAFGHVGMGGALGFVDTECRLAFGYSMTKMGGGVLLNERGQALVNAAYQSLGYSQISDGFWQK